MMNMCKHISGACRLHMKSFLCHAEGGEKRNVMHGPLGISQQDGMVIPKFEHFSIVLKNLREILTFQNAVCVTTLVGRLAASR